jgi:hypothetical protein
MGMLLTTLSPAVDFVSDIMYIVSTLFHNNIICIVTCFFFLLPMFFFWRMLLKHGIHFSFYVGTAPAFAIKEKYDSIPKALLGLAGYLPLYIINLPVSLPLFLIGHVLYCTKVFPISRVSNLWLRLYTRSTKHTSNVVILLPMLQESIFEEMLTESVPQMVIQIVNNTFTNVWSNLSYFSTAMSAMMILNGIWRLFYYRMYLKISITDIPNDLSADIFNFTSIEEGESSLAKTMSAKVAPSVELSSSVSAVGSPSPPPPQLQSATPIVYSFKGTALQMTESEGFADEFSPLIQRHIKLSEAALRTEMVQLMDAKFDAHMSELKTEFQAMKERSQLMDTQLQELISRSSAT